MYKSLLLSTHKSSNQASCFLTSQRCYHLAFVHIRLRLTLTQLELAQKETISFMFIISYLSINLFLKDLFFAIEKKKKEKKVKEKNLLEIVLMPKPTSCENLNRRKALWKDKQFWNSCLGRERKIVRYKQRILSWQKLTRCPADQISKLSCLAVCQHQYG